MLKSLYKFLFTKSVAKTIKEGCDMIEKGWSHYAPVQVDPEGNIIACCADTTLARIPRANPKARGIVQTVANQACAMSGIALLGDINRLPDMTQEKMHGIFRQALVVARAFKA